MATPTKPKSCGDRQVVTGTGEGCHWESLVTNLHVGGLYVMVVWSTIGTDWPFVSYADVRAGLFRIRAALPHSGEGVIKGTLNIARPTRPCQKTVSDWASKHAVENKKNIFNITIGSWNVRTLQDSESGPERRTATIAKHFGFNSILCA